ncbi:hypothetical protein [Sansalvadorimonas verongulae]|uniref:hypothetical protein n=1 Tax=Sansalvadorimonas verongulae TaxID=2172824 RepID=UPI0012BB622E|nr:hypothetical protein [Sansalvadorimonas verongulae]MTI14566.1 hypothetical protein [Sansalvadorimonas verongulae]
MSGFYKKGFTQSLFRLLLVWVVCTVAGGLPITGEAAGYTFHIFTTSKAVDQVSDENLKKLLKDRPHDLRAGAALPDGGYVNGFYYSEISHWPDFHVAYFQYVQELCQGQLDSELCEPLIAHMMGMIAHGFEDESYDTLMDRRSRKYKDTAIQSNTFLTGRDTLIDKYLLHDHMYLVDLIPIGVSPLDDLYKVFQGMGNTDVTYQHLAVGEQNILAGAVLKRVITNYWSDLQDSELYPWLRNNYETAPGGVEFTSAALAKLWNFYWDRLHQINRPAEPTIFPSDGGEIAVDEDDPWSEFHFLSDRPIDNESFIGEYDAIDLTTGGLVSLLIRRRNGYLISFVPDMPLTPGHQYKIIISPGIRDYWGQAVLQSELSWTVTAKAKLQ